MLLVSLIIDPRHKGYTILELCSCEMFLVHFHMHLYLVRWYFKVVLVISLCVCVVSKKGVIFHL